MRNIVLVGFMGTGKTAVGKALAKKLGREFMEMDELIEKKEKVSVKEIFDTKGEGYFRLLETDIAAKVGRGKGAIISAGGGAIVNEVNFKHLKKNGILICLTASPDVILERIKDLKTRPLLNVPDPKKKIEELLKQREPHYKKADYCIDTDHLTVEEIVEKITFLTYVPGT